MNTKDVIESLRRQILVHSCIYYVLDNNVISDKKYDTLSSNLVKLQQENPDFEGMYHYVFDDFDNNTGFDLFSRLTKEDKQHIMIIACNVLKQYQLDYGRVK